jgi:peptidoglycan LD-endopeptidase LytH
MKPTVVRILSALAVLAVAVPSVAQVTDDDIRRAQQELDRKLAESQELGDRVQVAWARQLELEHEIEKLEQSIGHTRVMLADAEERFLEVGVEMYMSAAAGSAMRLVVSATTSTYHAGMEYLRNVNGSGEELINQLTVFRTELERQTTRLGDASAEQAELTAELEEIAGQLLLEVADSQALYDRLVVEKRRQDEEERRRQEEERRRLEEERRRLEEARATTTTAAVATTRPSPTTTAPESTTTTQGGETTTTTTPPVRTGGGTCPVAGPVLFSDTWGAPRSGGRSHQGVDMIAARGTPIVAIYDGRIHRITTGVLSGYAVWLRADNGDLFFYAHLDGYGDISVGQQVPEGYVIGYNGSTGNAPDWLPHLHFEWHPSGIGAVNPYPLVKSLC